MKEQLGQYSEAIKDYDAAIRLKPDDDYTYYRRALAKYNVGHTWAAKQDFQTALKLAEQVGDENLKAVIDDIIRAYYY